MVGPVVLSCHCYVLKFVACYGLVVVIPYCMVIAVIAKIAVVLTTGALLFVDQTLLVE